MSSAVKKSVLDSPFGEQAVEVQTGVPRFVVMLITPVTTVIPNILYFIECFWFLPVQFLEEGFIDLLAVCMLTGGIDFQSLVYQVLF